MAVPVFRAAGAVASGTAAITPGMPSGVLTNDILLCILKTHGGEAITVSGGTETWAEVADSPQNIAAQVRLTVFWARASQNNPTSPTTSDSGNHQLGRIIAVSGVRTSGNPWDVTSGGTDTTSNTAGSITGDTTTLADCLVAAIMATNQPDSTGTTNFSAWTNADLASITERVDNTSSVSTGVGTGAGIGAATGAKATAGSYAATTVTLAAAAQKCFITIALTATAAGGVTAADGTSAGASTVSGVGGATVASPGSVAGTSAVSGVGGATVIVVGSAAGTSAVTGDGENANLGSVASAIGTSAVSGVGSATFASPGSVAGTSAVSGVGGATVASPGSVAGTSAVSGVGGATVASPGSVAGTSAVSGVAAALAAALGAIIGTSAVSGVGGLVREGVGTSTSAAAAKTVYAPIGWLG